MPARIISLAIVACVSSAANAGSLEMAARKKASRSVSLKGIVSVELLAKTKEIVEACGSVVVSARHGRGYRSNHPIGRAVDLRGNPDCIYERLKGWPGGVSTDYATAPNIPHVHISYNPGGQEWGRRFAHERKARPAVYASALPPAPPP